MLNLELQLGYYYESKCQNQELQHSAQERPGRGEKNGRKTLKIEGSRRLVTMVSQFAYIHHRDLKKKGGDNQLS